MSGWTWVAVGIAGGFAAIVVDETWSRRHPSKRWLARQQILHAADLFEERHGTRPNVLLLPGAKRGVHPDSWLSFHWWWLRVGRKLARPSGTHDV